MHTAIGSHLWIGFMVYVLWSMAYGLYNTFKWYTMEYPTRHIQETSRIFHGIARENIAELFIPSHIAYSDQHGQCDIRVVHCGKVGYNTAEYTTTFMNTCAVIPPRRLYSLNHFPQRRRQTWWWSPGLPTELFWHKRFWTFVECFPFTTSKQLISVHW